MTKKKLNIASGIAIAVGVAGFVLTGGTEAGAGVIVTGSIALVGAVVALITAIKG